LAEGRVGAYSTKQPGGGGLFFGGAATTGNAGQAGETAIGSRFGAAQIAGGSGDLIVGGGKEQDGSLLEIVPLRSGGGAA